MTDTIKRLRVFAGPNGSGKSTLYDYLIRNHAFTPYYHINPDDISRDLSVSVDLLNWPFSFTPEEIVSYLDSSPFQAKCAFRLSEQIEINDKSFRLKDPDNETISYLAAALSAFLRVKMLNSGSSFSFESVFSHPSKVTELAIAKKKGYRVYLYYIATQDPIINAQRVQNRVELGGHDVPDLKISERYFHAMENLYTAVLASDRVFFFDNSDKKADGSYNFFAEKRDNHIYTVKTELPQWFDTYLLKKLV